MGKNQLFNHLTLSGKNMSWSELAAMYNFPTGEAARCAWKNYRNKSTVPFVRALATTQENTETQNYISTLEDRIVKYEEDLKNNKAELTADFKKEVTSLDELIERCKIDTNKWEITKYTQSAASGRYNVKAWLEARVESKPQVIADILKDYRSSYEPLTKAEICSFHEEEEGTLLVLSLADLHLDKQNYITKTSIREQGQRYANCLSTLATKAVLTHNVEKILFVIGNDFFHTDTIQGTTTSGTPLNSSSASWNEAFEEGFDLMVNCITFLRQITKELHVMLVPGNHAFSKEFYMAHGLKMFFAGDNNIKFDISPIERKIFTHGEVFLGLSHGNCKRDKLPLTFATEFGQEFGKRKYRELLLGDKHTDRQTSYAAKNEFSGVQVRELPSLSGTDKWHYENQFVENVQRGVALIYSPKEGKIAELYKNM